MRHSPHSNNNLLLSPRSGACSELATGKTGIFVVPQRRKTGILHAI